LKVALNLFRVSSNIFHCLKPNFKNWGLPCYFCNVSGDMYSKCNRTQHCMETTIVLRIDGFLLTTLYLLFKYFHPVLIIHDYNQNYVKIYNRNAIYIYILILDCWTSSCKYFMHIQNNKFNNIYINKSECYLINF
jgi:hypothetical protein